MNKYLVVVLMVGVAVVAYVYFGNNAVAPSPSPSPSASPRISGTPRACTLEAKMCPDGSAVGRVGPNCEFAPCPTVRPTPTPAYNY